MFKIEEVLGVSFDNKVLPISSINSIILVPEVIEDTISKINNLGFEDAHNLNFVNGYAIKSDGTIINKKGQTFRNFAFKDGRIMGLFSQNRLLTQSGYLIGLTGNYVNIRTTFLEGKSFSEGYAPIKDSEGRWVYIDLDGNVAANGCTFIEASCFFGGYAIVKVPLDYGKTGWQIIDRDFKKVECNFFDAARSDYNFYKMAVKTFDNNPNLTRIDSSIQKIESGNITIFIDKNINLSIKVYDILNAISAKLGIPLIEGNAMEQLVDIINKASTKGTFSLNLDSLAISKVETVKGVKISDDSGHEVVSFEEKDVEIVKSRIRKKEKDE
jgi:hypothetical protein